MSSKRPPTGSVERARTQRLVVLVLAGALSMNYPLLFVFGSSGLFLGIPVLYLYLFLTWAIFIALGASILEGEASAPDRRSDVRPRARR